MSTTDYQVVFITGCTEGGIGHSLALKFAEEGCKVYASARKLDSLTGFDRSKFVHPIQKLIVDVTKPSTIQSAVEEIIKKDGRIDILVANAGVGATSPLMDIDLEDFKKVYETNVFGLVATFQPVLPHMARRGQGKVILIGSCVGYNSTPWAGCYSSSKAAVHSIGDALRREVAGLGIQVQIVAPGGIKSNIVNSHQETIKFKQDSFFNEEPVKKMIEARASISQQNATPSDEFAAAVVREALKPTLRSYFTLGKNAILLWLAYYLPPFLSDYLAALKLGTNKVRSYALQLQNPSKKEN